MADPPERSSAENGAVLTVSSFKSEDSTEQLICKTPQRPRTPRSVPEEGGRGGEGAGGRRAVAALGLTQVLLGALLLGAGALAVARGAALARVGAPLWAGAVAVVAGVVGVLAGINDCCGLTPPTNGSPLLTAFLALSLLSVACGNSAAVLAATGLQRDAARPPLPNNTFEDEKEAWTPVLTNIAVLIIASLHCLVSVVSVYHASKRVCPCFRPKQPFDHNQFDPAFKPVQPCVFHVDEIKKAQDLEKIRGHELCKELEAKLQGETLKKKKMPPALTEAEFGSANSKEKLVSRWLGRHAPGAPVPALPAVPAVPAASAARRRPGVRKGRKPAGTVMLLPAHPASTLGRGPPMGVMVQQRYATLPLPLPPPYPPLYYPVHDPRLRRRGERRAARGPGRGGRGARRAGGAAGAGSLTRSLERIHRKRRADRDRLSDDDLKRTYTGLDRAYAEQFIAVCDESRHAAEQHDSLTTTATTTTHSHSHDH